MKILVACGNTNDDSAAWWRISNIARLLKEKYDYVDFAHFFTKKRGQTDESKISMPDTDHYYFTSPHVTAPLKHLKLLIDQKYDIVYANGQFVCFSALLGKVLATPLVIDIHGGLVEEFRLMYKDDIPPRYLFKQMGFQSLESVCTKASDRISCVSHNMIKYYQEQGVPRDKMGYITNGVDLNFFNSKNVEDETAELKEQMGLENKLVLGYIGNFQSYQGVENLISAANIASKKREFDKIVFMFVGSTEHIQQCRNMIFIPKVNRNLLLNYYCLSDVLILPRPYHIGTDIAAPTKFAEYVSMGKPVLTTNVGDAANLVMQHKCGIVIENNNIETLIGGISEINDLTPEDLDQMGRNSRRLAETEFDWNIIKHSLYKMIDSL